MYMYDIALGVSYLHTRRFVNFITGMPFFFLCLIHRPSIIHRVHAITHLPDLNLTFYLGFEINEYFGIHFFFPSCFCRHYLYAHMLDFIR